MQTEFNAAQRALAYVERHGQQQAIYTEVLRLSPRDLASAGRNVEQTYFTRLFAEFEGILKDHLASNHPSVVVSDKATVDWLIRRTTQRETVKITPLLRGRIDAVRSHRNAIAHRGRNPVPAITLVAALSTLNTFLAKLARPLT